MKNQNGLLRLMLDCLGVGIVAADKNGRCLLVNPMAERILGLTWGPRGGVTAATLENTLPEPMARAIRGEETNEVELFLKHPKSPEGIFVSITGRPLKDKQGVVQGGVVVMRDITQKRYMEEALHQVMEDMEDSVKARTA